MNFIGERETAGNVVKKRCSEIGMLFRILFWISLLFLAAKVIWTIYIGTMPEASFRLTLMEAEGLTYGVAAYEAGQRIEFQEGVLSYAASSSPKLCFMAGRAVSVLLGAVTTWILWLVRRIFRNVEKQETPFEKENSRAVRRIGFLVVVYSLVYTLVLPLLCSALGLGRAQVSLVDGKMVLVGCLIISLSYIFEYGSALQQEADETL